MDSSEEKPTELPVATTANKCGIIMPISSFPDSVDYTENHWRLVKTIIQRGSLRARSRYQAELVSKADVPTFIQRQIIFNIYSYDIVICDVSGLNPNVLFELGLRLAAEKPVIIIKDDKTRFIFDTSLITHFEYRRDLRYDAAEQLEQEIAQAINKFEEQLVAKEYESFLSQIKIPNLQLAQPTLENVDLGPYLVNINQKIDQMLAGQAPNNFEIQWPEHTPDAITQYSSIYNITANILKGTAPGSFTNREMLDQIMQAINKIPILGNNIHPGDIALRRYVIQWIIFKYIPLKLDSRADLFFKQEENPIPFGVPYMK